MKRTLGVCYYPEQWDEAVWESDARRMAALGLTWVRIGEFAWGRMEAAEGAYDWGWLDRAIAVLGNAGLKVVLGTPTATPPRWMLTKNPHMLALDKEGRRRGFGSRRHYCFSSRPYRAECARIVTAMAERYGRNPYVAAWQTDNEYACHDTVLSYSDAALHAFRDWLAQRYQSPQALNRAWGNVFWSMDYASFDEIGLPNLTVTEANPAHVMAFRRFASDEVVSFNRLQVDILRRYSDAPIAHNYMGQITDFDHFAVGADLDIAAWDAYPLGFLSDRLPATAEHRRRFVRQGDPDFQAFHHRICIGRRPGPLVGDGTAAARSTGPRGTRTLCPAWRGFGRGKRLRTGRRPCVISAGGKPPSRRNRCTPGCCDRIQRRLRPLPRRNRSRARWRRCRMWRSSGPRWRSCSTTPRPGRGRRSRRGATSAISGWCSRRTAACAVWG